MTKEEILSTANRVDTVFYCLYTENKQLKEHTETKIATDCAKDMGAELFAIRSGKKVQDPKSLYEELSYYDNIQMYNIIVIKTDTMDVTRISMDDKRQLLEILKNYRGTENSGEIAFKLLQD